MRPWPLVVLLAALAGAFAACGASGDDGGAVVVISTPQATNPNLALSSTPTPLPTPAPAPDIVLSADTIYQAGAAIVSVVGDIGSGTVTFIGRSYPLTKGSKSMYAFVAADADDPPGRQPLKVDFALKNGSKGSLTSSITVVPAAWTSDSVTIPASLTPLLDPAVANAELATLAKVYGTVTPEKLWAGQWQLPVQGTITTRFGDQRSYNGAPPAGRHGGSDIGAEAGAPVIASNGGRVVFARQLQIRGNMVILDHGGGLFSGYAHLSSFAVAEGQVVKAGDIIGYAGSTGLSTGAHLHWEMSVGGVLVDALRFFDGTNGF